MAFDDVIPLLGDFGRYQKRIYFLLCIPAILCAFHKLGNVFLEAKGEYRCRLPDELPNATYALPNEILVRYYPYNNDTQQFSACTMYVNGTEEACSTFVYDYTEHKSSATFEWDMVCGRAYLTSTADALFMVGVMLGSIIFGEMSDMFGRKKVFFVCLVAQVIFGVGTALAPDFWTFTITRAAIGASTTGTFLVAYVIAMEMVSPEKRQFAGTFCHIFFATGYMLTAVLAYYITDWRYYQLALTLPGLLFFSYWWFIPESIRWLIMKDRLEEAKQLIHAAAKVNKVTICDKQLDELLSDHKPVDPEEKRATIVDLFRHKNLRHRSLVIFFDWFANGITYFGLSWNTSNLGGNDYLNFLISGAVEIPAYIFLMFTLNKWGRKYILCGSMVIAGICLLLTLAIQGHWMVVTFAMLGKLAITCSYGTIYIFSIEQFPTVIRNAGLGAGSVSARIGGILAPFINETSNIFLPMPLIIFGCFSLIGGCASLLLPETLHKQLPESIQDGEKFGTEDTVDYPEEEDGLMHVSTEPLRPHRVQCVK